VYICFYLSFIEFLRKALNALLDPIENDNVDEGGIIPAKRNSWIGKEQWEQLSIKGGNGL